MKKTLLFLIAAGTLLVASCSKDEAPAPQNEGIKLNLKIAGPGAGVDTKAAKKAWTAGDKLNIWLDNNAEQTEPDLIITYDGTEWKAGSFRTGCTPNASGKIAFLYEGYNDVSTKYYTTNWYANRMWFTPKRPKEDNPGGDSFCRPLIVLCDNIDYTFSSNTLTATVISSDWYFETKFKVLIKQHASLKDADYYNLQVHNTTHSTSEAYEYADQCGAFIIIPDNPVTIIGNGSANYKGWAGGVKEADGIAFYYSSFVATGDDITFTLMEYEGTTKTYSVTNKTISAKDKGKCNGITLKYENFN